MIRLKNVIENVLDAQKLELGQMDFKINDFEVDKLLDRIEKKFRFILDEKGIKLNLSKDGIIVKSDDSRIEQVLINLLLNAIEFVPKEKGLIEINVKEQDHSAIFSVKDNGTGISKGDQKQLFEKFHQVDSSLRRKHEGAGLGLAVCKGIVERLGGKIGLDSVLGTGSVFYFSVPL
jgi:signal transduction histidine kinase